MMKVGQPFFMGLMKGAINHRQYCNASQVTVRLMKLPFIKRMTKMTDFSISVMKTQSKYEAVTAEPFHMDTVYCFAQIVKISQSRHLRERVEPVVADPDVTRRVKQLLPFLTRDNLDIRTRALQRTSLADSLNSR